MECVMRSADQQRRHDRDFDAGRDVSLASTSICIVDDGAKVAREGKVPSDADAIELFLAEWGIHVRRGGLEAFSFSA
jgi:transposase